MPERNIDTAINSDPKCLAVGPVARALFRYLMTSTMSHPLGIFALPMYIVDHEFGFPRNVTLDAMAELSRKGLAHYDTERQVVWVVNMAKRMARSPQVWRGIENHLRALHGSPLIRGFVDRYSSLTFETKRGEVRPVASSMASDAEQVPGNMEWHQWFEKGYATLAEPLPNPSTTLGNPWQPFGNPSSTSPSPSPSPCSSVANTPPSPSGTTGGGNAPPHSGDPRLELVAEEPRPKTPARKPRGNPDVGRVRDWWRERYRAEYGCEATWGGKQNGQARSLLSAHGLEEVQRRGEILLTSPPSWLAGPHDFGTLVQHFDKLAKPAEAKPVPRGLGGDRAADHVDRAAEKARELARRGL